MGLNQIVLLAAQVEDKAKPMSERMGTALLNTVMGIGIVFLVLILISAIISCFSIINKIEKKLQSKKEQIDITPQVDVVMESITQQEEEELADDLELVAVITSAIHAYEEACGHEVPANGLYVRSIKKVNKAKWLNA
jgi:sodium pump decarboxylase gamma subunit